MGRVGALAPRLEDDAAVDFVDFAPPSVSPAETRMQAIADFLGAADFCLFSVLASADSMRLVPIASSQADYAEDLKRQHTCLAPVMEEATPAAWPADDAGASAMSRWMRRIAGPLDGRSAGLAFPLTSERGGAGLAVFATVNPPDDEALCAAHMDCYAVLDEYSRSRNSVEAGLPALSKRELECLKLTADGLTSDEIACRLGLSVHTANQYLANTTQKLNAVNRMHAVAKALRSGLFD
jgi:DNA-binding CsgD family transcriptional regulator